MLAADWFNKARSIMLCSDWPITAGNVDTNKFGGFCSTALCGESQSFVIKLFFADFYSYFTFIFNFVTFYSHFKFILLLK